MPGINPRTEGQKGCKRHVLTDAGRFPLVVCTGPANRSDADLALELIDAIPTCGGRRGRPRRWQRAFQGDGA